MLAGLVQQWISLSVCLTYIHTYNFPKPPTVHSHLYIKAIEDYPQLGRPDPRPSCPCAPRMHPQRVVPGSLPIDNPLASVPQPRTSRGGLDWDCNAFTLAQLAAYQIISMHRLCCVVSALESHLGRCIWGNDLFCDINLAQQKIRITGTCYISPC